MQQKVVSVSFSVIYPPAYSRLSCQFWAIHALKTDENACCSLKVRRRLLLPDTSPTVRNRATLIRAVINTFITIISPDSCPAFNRTLSGFLDITLEELPAPMTSAMVWGRKDYIARN